MFRFQSGSPSADSLNALGVYLLVSLFFVIGTMIEFAIVLVIKRKMDSKMNSNSDDPRTVTAVRRKKMNYWPSRLPKTFTAENPIPTEDSKRNQPPTVIDKIESESITDKIDMAAFFLFLFSYFIFNIVYLSWYNK